MSRQIGLAIVIRHCGIHVLVHHYRDCKPAAQTHSVACRRCPVLLSRVTTGVRSISYLLRPYATVSLNYKRTRDHESIYKYVATM